MAYVDGYSGEEMVSEVLGMVNISNTDAAGIAEALRALNASQLEMAMLADWPQLLYPDASFTTDGSTYYDLSDGTVLGDEDLDGAFCRIMKETVRTATRKLFPKSHGMIVSRDEGYTAGGDITHFAIINKKKFMPWPVGSTGDTIYFDMLCNPVKITSDTTAAEITFDPTEHELIIEGAFYMGMRKYRKADWGSQYQIWKKTVKEHAGRAKMMKGGITYFIPEKI